MKTTKVNIKKKKLESYTAVEEKSKRIETDVPIVWEI